MATDVNRIHIGQGDVWVGGTPPAAGVDPLDPTTSTVNSMTTAFAAPTSGGTAVGFTNGAATLTYRPTYYMVETEQAFAEVITVPTAEESTLAITMQEMGYQNIATAWGQGTTKVTAGPPANNAIFVGGKPTVIPAVVVLNSRKRSGAGYFILTLYQGYSAEGAAVNFERRAESRIPATIRCLSAVNRPQGDQLFQIADWAANPA
jgi:hypothetical protein